MLDLAVHYELARRIAWKHPTFLRALDQGHDAEEIWQEICVRVLRRQRGRSAYDPSRSSPAKYLYLCVGSIVSNYLRDQAHRTRNQVDAEEAEASSDADWSVEMRSVVEAVAEECGMSDIERQILERLVAGRLRSEIRTELGLPLRSRGQQVDLVHQVIEEVKRWAR